jgi:hypothetical protein
MVVSGHLAPRAAISGNLKLRSPERGVIKGERPTMSEDLQVAPHDGSRPRLCGNAGTVASDEAALPEPLTVEFAHRGTASSDTPFVSEEKAA